ncbi:transposase [Arsenophonus sp.]|uniref:transposase n=1 Tax=Arsenophonus sp. TaxID=1872640 RepID=UPI0038799F49
MINLNYVNIMAGRNEGAKSSLVSCVPVSQPCYVSPPYLRVGGNESMQFDLAKVRKRWMWNARQYLLSVWGKIYLPESLPHIRDYDEWQRFILNAGKNAEGKDYWHVYFADPTSNAKKTAKYLGRCYIS